MVKLYLSLIYIFVLIDCFSQVGINTNDPKTSLDVNGAITNREVNFIVQNNNVNISIETSLANISGSSTSDITITCYTPAINGHRLIIYNNTSSGNAATFYGTTIENGSALEFVYSNQNWKQLSTTSTSQSPSSLNQLITNVADLGVLPDGNDYSTLIRDVIANANGEPLFFPAGQYVYDGNVIPTDRVNIIGVMPNFINDTLHNGTIFLNKMHFTGTHVSVQGFGVQLFTPEDGFRVTPPMNTGRYCRVRDIVTVGANKTSPFHSFLLEGIDFAQVENIECYNAFMGQVFKINSGNLTNLRCYNIAKESIFIKSDNTSGNCRNLTLDGVHIENSSAGTATGIKINSAGAQMQNLSISNVNIQKAQFGVSILSSGGNGVAINDLNLSNIRIDVTTLKCFYLEANLGFIYKVNLSNIDATSIAKSLFETVGSVKYVNISNLNADITSATNQSEKEKIINFGATTLFTNLSNINITKGYTVDNQLAVNYQNDAETNRAQNYNVKLRGNVPQSGFSSLISSTSFDVTPVLSSIDNESFIELTASNDGTLINSISISPDLSYPSELFQKGYRLYLKNTSPFTIEIEHNPSGNIHNPNDLTIVLPPYGITCYVFDGTLWVQTVASETKRLIRQTLDNGDVVLDNIKVSIPSTGNKSLQISTVSGAMTISGHSTNFYSNVLVDGNGASTSVSHWKVYGKVLDTNNSYWQSDLNLLQPGDLQEIVFKNDVSQLTYKVSFTLGENDSNHYVKIERLD